MITRTFRPMFESSRLEEGHLRLKSDFRDFYDHWFASLRSDHPVFVRTAATKRTRIQDLRLLESHGMHVPRYGTVAKLAPWLRANRSNPTMVVHFGDGGRQHRGEGKMVVSAREQATGYRSMVEHSWPDVPAVEYVSQPQHLNPQSFRYLQIGDGPDRIRCWFRYQSKSDVWRSNVGDVEIDFIRDPRPVGQQIPIEIPTLGLYAVDFVVSNTGLFYAIDYNDAPGLRHTGLEEVIDGEEIYDIIRATYRRNAD